METTGHLDGVGAGKYELTISDLNNCMVTWSDSLTEPDILALHIATTNVNCTGLRLGSAMAQITGGNLPYQYNWSTSQTSANINNLAPGDYILVANDLNSCMISDTVTIIQNTEVTIQIQIEDQISCNSLSDGVLRADASDGVGPYDYLWLNGGPASDRYAGLSEGTYTVTVIDSEGCEGMETIDLTDPDPLRPYFEVADVSCFGFTNGNVVLDAIGGSGNYRFYWNDVLLVGNEAANLFADSYMLKVRDEQNCEADTVVTVNQPEKLTISMDEQGSVRPFCPDWQNGVLSIHVKGGTRDYNYAWDYSASEQDSVIRNIREDAYGVTVTDALGCIADTVFNLRALQDNCLGVPTAFTPNSDNANDFWEIRYMTETGSEVTFDVVYPGGEIKIYDRIGNLVYRCTGGCPADWNGDDMHGRPLPVDTYYYIIDLNTGNGDAPLRGIVTIIR